VFLLAAADARGQGCTVTTSPVRFNAYSSISQAASDGVGEVRVSCDVNLPYTVKLDPGANSGGTFIPRRMRRTGGGETLTYNLFRDVARTEVWGDGTGSTFVKPGSGTGIPTVHAVYGRTPGQQAVPAGSYQDTVTVLVEW
jgi:spore coat protein U-like protein